MADIKDIYTLEFNAAIFTAEIDSAIGKIEQLNSTMNDSAESVEELESAQQQLSAVLGTEAKTVTDLNAKRNVLVQTQGKLNKETKTGAAVTNELTNTNKKLAVETGNTVNGQKSLIGQFMGGVRSINSMRRAAGLLVSGFRLLAAAVPFGLILSVLPGVVSWFSSLFGAVDKNAIAMEKLKDESLGYGERITIIQDEIERLNAVEARRGYLTEEEKKQRDELTKKYKETADEIVKIEQERADSLRAIDISLQEARIQFYGDTVKGATEAAKLETSKLFEETGKRLDKLVEDSLKIDKELKKLEGVSGADAENRAAKLRREGQKNFDAQMQVIEEQGLRKQFIEQQTNEKIQRLIDEANKKKEAAEQLRLDKLAADFIAEYNMRKAFLDEIERREQESFDERERLRLAELESINAMHKANEDNLKQLQDNLNTASQYRQNNAETNLNNSLLYLEIERNAELLAAFGNADLQAEIDKEYNEKRISFEKMAAEEIIKIRIDFLEKLREASSNDPLMISELNKTISELKVKLAELGKKTEDTGDKVKLTVKEIIEETSKLVQQVSDAVFDVLNTQLDTYISNLDKAVDRSKSTLDEIRNNSENFNARQLEMERDRLEQLQEERRKAVEKEKALALIQLTINSTLAIAKSAAEGGLAAPFTIAATIIALIAGFATARAAAGSAFYEGTEYLQRGNNPKGRDQIPIMANEGEAIIPTDTTKYYRAAVSAIYNRSVPANAMNDFVKNYKSGNMPKMSDPVFLSDFGVRPILINAVGNNSGLERRLESIESALLDLPKYMPQTTVTANANGIFKIVERRQKAKELSRKIAT